MSEAVLTGQSFFVGDAGTDADPVRLPKPQPFGAPVFLTDAVTPLAGETVLSLLMKRLASQSADEDAD